MFHPHRLQGPCPLRSKEIKSRENQGTPLEGGREYFCGRSPPGSWILPSVGAQVLPAGGWGGQPAARAAGGGGDERRRGGLGRTRLASGPCAPKPQESQAPSSGDKEALLRGSRVCPQPSPFTPGRAAAGARGRVCALPGLRLFIFLAGQSCGIPSSPQARGQSGSALARDPAPEGVCLASPRGCAWGMQVRSVGGLWARPSQHHFSLSLSPTRSP